MSPACQVGLPKTVPGVSDHLVIPLPLLHLHFPLIFQTFCWSKKFCWPKTFCWSKTVLGVSDHLVIPLPLLHLHFSLIFGTLCWSTTFCWSKTFCRSKTVPGVKDHLGIPLPLLHLLLSLFSEFLAYQKLFDDQKHFQETLSFLLPLLHLRFLLIFGTFCRSQQNKHSSPQRATIFRHLRVMDNRQKFEEIACFRTPSYVMWIWRGFFWADISLCF